jgi:5-oxoprolinase (ATP-hydrolysing)
MLEVFNNPFMAIAEQMACARHTAYSVNIKERLDFSCALSDQHGALIANAPHMPVHLFMGNPCARHPREHGAQGPRDSARDVFMPNAPYNGGTHLPDITVITSVFDPDGTVSSSTWAARHHAMSAG